MDLRQLRYFLALTEHRSFVKAADAMGITQPAFSRSIQGLEQELGCQLVDRGSKDLRPTPEGRVVMQHALALVRGASNLAQEINQMTKLDAGYLAFGSDPVAAARLVPDAQLRFTRQYPRMRTRIDVDNGETLSRSLSRDDIEFFVGDTQSLEADPTVRIRPLAPHTALFFCRAGHPLLEKDSLSTNDLFHYPLAAARIAPGMRKVLANLSGKTQFDWQVECEQFQVIEHLVRHSDSIGLATPQALERALRSGEVVQLHLRNLDHLQIRCGIATRTGYRLSLAAQVMIELLVELDQQ
ncbi:MAG: LysR family transcriptional regulator [Pseudomonas sp.]|uniref:LysR family transcriptional regulator n=1 Tax=Pseudomonas sp. TaxID=306 RepID=UPI003D0FC5AC